MSDAALTIDEMAAEVDRERSTVYRSLQRLLNDWYAQMGQLIGEFRTKYDTGSQSQPAVEG